jgi:hypothetical protein
MKIKIFLLIFLFIIIIHSIDALKITASPAHINLNTEVDKEICKKISISSDKKIIIYLEDKWSSKNQSISLGSYNLSANNFQIGISYPNVIKLDSKKSLDICIIPKKAGNYNGILLLTSSNKLAGVAILIQLNVSELEKEYSFSPITGNIIKLDSQNRPKNFNFVFILILGLFLLLIFLWILKKWLIKNR